MIRFIHAADIHLDSLMRGLDTKLADIDPSVFRLSTRKALKNLVDWAVAENVDFVTLGGDNYDGDWRDHQTGLYFAQQMARLGSIPVVSITGNHDAQSKITRTLRLPPTFHRLSEETPEIYQVIPGVRIVGQGFKNQSESRNLARGYPDLDGVGIKIGLLHTSLAGGKRDGHDDYAPCSLDDLRFKHYHFWGLGHIHKHSWEALKGDVPILFPGNLQGRHIRETGPKGAYLIKLDDDGSFISEEFKPLDETRWEELLVNIGPFDSIDELWSHCEREFRAMAEQAGGRVLAVRLRIEGVSRIHKEILKMQSGAEDALLAELQNAANMLTPGLIWVEHVQVSSHSPVQIGHATQAMRTLREFIQTKAMADSWLDEFLEMKELKQLRNQASYFREADQAEMMGLLFDKKEIAMMLAEIPELLEVRLNSSGYQKTRES